MEQGSIEHKDRRRTRVGVPLGVPYVRPMHTLLPPQGSSPQADGFNDNRPLNTGRMLIIGAPFGVECLDVAFGQIMMVHLEDIAGRVELLGKALSNYGFANPWRTGNSNNDDFDMCSFFWLVPQWRGTGIKGDRVAWMRLLNDAA